MIIRNLDASWDFTFGQGRSNYRTGEAAIQLNLATRLKSFLNDCFWAMNFGIDWWNLLGSKQPAAEANIILQTRAMIAASFGVVRVNRVASSVDVHTRRLTLVYNIDDIYTRNVTGTIQP